MLKVKDFKKGTHCIVGVGNLPCHLYRCTIIYKIDNYKCVVWLEPYNSGYKDKVAAKNNGYHVVDRNYLSVDNGFLDFSYDHDNPLCDYNVFGGIF